MPGHFRVGMGVNNTMFAEGLTNIERALQVRPANGACNRLKAQCSDSFCTRRLPISPT